MTDDSSFIQSNIMLDMPFLSLEQLMTKSRGRIGDLDPMCLNFFQELISECKVNNEACYVKFGMRNSMSMVMHNIKTH